MVSLFLIAASVLIVGLGAALIIGLLAMAARRVARPTADPRFWRGPDSAPLTLACFMPCLGLTVSVLMKLNGEFVTTRSLFFAVVAGLPAGIATALLETSFLRQRLKHWRGVHDASALMIFGVSISFAVIVPPHSAEQFWSFLTACGLGWFGSLAIRLPTLPWHDLDERGLA